MVVQKGGGFREIQNAMDLSNREKCFENSSTKLTAASASVQESAAEERDETVETLQSAFLKFKRNRQNKIRQLALSQKKSKLIRSEEQLVKLREKFVEQAKTYFGVPYARRYHEPGSPEFDSPLFLDCCGLVRKVLRDMKEDFGFSIGPWNQAYMFDTLPHTIEDVNDMKAGDLVFVSGTFYNPKKRKQKHNIVHVEIWAGDGEKTIGARWQKGKVQIHESYQYVSKSYYDMVYHFKSIDTWLNGTCKSFCSQHSWKSSSYLPGKKSVFSLPQIDQPADYHGGDEISKEMEDSDETDQNMSDGNRFQTKVEDDEEVSVVVCDKEKSGYVETKMQEQNKDICTEEDFIYCKTKTNNIEKKDAKNQATFEENEPKSGTKLNQNSISTARNADYVRLVVQEGDRIDHQDFNFKLEDPSQESSDEVLGTLTQNISNDNGKHFESMYFENACFCERCLSVVDILTLENDKSQHCKLYNCSQNTRDATKGLKKDQNFCTLPETVREVYSDLEQGSKSNVIKLYRTLDEAAHFASRPNTGGAAAGSPRKRGLTTQAVSRRGKGSSRQGANGDDDQTNNPREPSKPFCRPSLSLTRLHQKAPTFFIGGHNGAKMVEATLSSLGWKRIHDKDDPTFYLKWVECKRNLDFASFREGEQLVNHIPNGNLLTTKIGLLTSLQEFDRVSNKVPSPNRRYVEMKDFVPETFKLQNQTEIDNFINHTYQDGEMWICKPTGMNQGKGIFLIRNREELLEKLGPKVSSSGRQRCFPSPGKVVQRYILNPFLLNGYKADIRTYMLIAGTSPYMVFYHPGYVRLSLVPYSLTQEEVHAHLTNQYIQKKHPLYEQVKEETVWSLEQLQEYINKTSSNTLPPDWVFTTFTKRMQEIMLHCFQSVRYKLDRKLGYFDLLGFDFMLDENLNVWLIEINVNPALHTNCKILSGIIPELVDSTLRLVLEVFEKSKRKEKILPLENPGKFQLIFTDVKKS